MGKSLLSTLFPPFFKPPANNLAARRQLATVLGLVVALFVLIPDLRYALWRLVEYPMHYQEYRHFGIPLPGRYEVHGIDVSRYQHKIDWARVKRMEVGKVHMSFVFIKATEGSWLKDAYFNHNWKQARSEGLIRGAYHYFLPDISPKDQAKHFIRTVKLSPGDLPPVVDVEEKRGMSREQVRTHTKMFMDLLQKHYGVKPILYTNRDFYKNHFANEPDFEAYPRWIAHYRTNRLSLPDDSDWQFWQHNDEGRVNGINEPVDFNVFQGNLSELKKLCVP